MREFRLGKDLSQKVLAQTIGVSQSLLSAWESGGAIPGSEHLQRYIELGADKDKLDEARVQTDARSNTRPRTIDRILYDADDFLQGNPSTVWVIGPEQLPVLENARVRDAWVRNLTAGTSITDYNLIWVLDRVAAEELEAALPHFADLASRAGQVGAEAPGRIIFHAITAEAGDTARTGVTIETYERFRQALQREPEISARLVVHPYVPCAQGRGDRRDACDALSHAVRDLIYFWQPETGLVLYSPKSLVKAPVANIRLMPVSEHVADGNVERPMYWLAPRGAARLGNIIARLDGALSALRDGETRELPVKEESLDAQ